LKKTDKVLKRVLAQYKPPKDFNKEREKKNTNFIGVKMEDEPLDDEDISNLTPQIFLPSGM
jgi:hypothetical protein